jgi:hypothetical protein
VYPFCNLQSRARTHAVLVIGLYELLGNPTTYLIEPLDPPGNLVEIRIPKRLDKDTGDSKQSSSQRDYSPGTPASSTTKTGRHDIAEILLKVELNTKNHQIM